MQTTRAGSAPSSRRWLERAVAPQLRASNGQSGDSGLVRRRRPCKVGMQSRPLGPAGEDNRARVAQVARANGNNQFAIGRSCAGAALAKVFPGRHLRRPSWLESAVTLLGLPSARRASGVVYFWPCRRAGNNIARCAHHLQPPAGLEGAAVWACELRVLKLCPPGERDGRPS